MSSEVINVINAVGDDIVGHTMYPKTFDKMFEVTEGDLGGACYELFDNAHEIVAKPADGYSFQPPVFAITEQMLAMAACPYRPPSGNYKRLGCFSAELRFSRSLKRHTRSEKIDSGRLPAAVLYDANGRPFAYQKADGIPTAYTWRPARIDTKAGPRQIPSEALISIAYGKWHGNGYAADPRRGRKGEGITPLWLRDCPVPDEVYFQRSSLNCVPLLVRQVSLSSAILQNLRLAEYYKDASMLTGRKVARRALAALRAQGMIE
jgi:hypothetical protein